MRQSKYNAFLAAHALIADALHRCMTFSAETCITITCREVPESYSSPAAFRFSVADTGPGIQADRFQDYFPQYSKPCFSALHPSAEQWSSEVTWGEN
ncbi:unnamed protein product [Sphagnum jensenii]|uniref:Histidine kinase/HSP90-like ATPase domain-containing protein n=1 Tax=Sphagnum jensenii TaxID=128206 RepID=A0ABP0WKW1_9BRYO